MVVVVAAVDPTFADPLTECASCHIPQLQLEFEGVALPNNDLDHLGVTLVSTNANLQFNWIFMDFKTHKEYSNYVPETFLRF